MFSRGKRSEDFQNKCALRLLYCCGLRRLAITQKISEWGGAPAPPQQDVKGKGKRVKERILPRHNGSRGHRCP